MAAEGGAVHPFGMIMTCHQPRGGPETARGGRTRAASTTLRLTEREAFSYGRQGVLVMMIRPNRLTGLFRPWGVAVEALDALVTWKD